MFMTGRITHGHTRGRKTTPEFRTWCAMKQRCYDTNAEKYPVYGGRGVTVCARWRYSFESFLADMGPRPPNCTIDRYPNRTGNYKPDNCRWATPKQQAENRSRNSFNGPPKTHCPSGHLYAGRNVRITPTGRKCRECERLRAMASRAKVRASQ